MTAAKKYFNGLVGLAIFGLVAVAVYGGAGAPALIGAGVSGLALYVGADLVTSVIPDDPPKPPSS